MPGNKAETTSTGKISSPIPCRTPKRKRLAALGRTGLASSASRPDGPPSPPLAERAGERRPFTPLSAALPTDSTEGCGTKSGSLLDDGGLVSLSHSSGGGEGSGAAGGEHRDACEVQASATRGAEGRRDAC